jgi:hypothetical protein
MEDEEENDRIYQESQEQRAIERDIRKWKTEALSYQAAGDQEGFEKAALKVKEKQADYRSFCKDTGRTPRNDRTQVFGYDRSTAAKARAAAKDYTPTPKAPVKQAPIFEKAATKEEATKYAERFASWVDYGRISLDNINKVNETLLQLTDRYPTNELGVIKTARMKAVARSNYNALELNATKLGRGSMNSDFELLQGFDKATLKTLESRYPNGYPKDIQRQIDKLNKNLRYKRWVVADEVEGIIAHEYGHILCDQYFGMFNDKHANPNARTLECVAKVKLIEDTRMKAINNGDIYDISKYGATDAGEFFAETFCAKWLGWKLPKYIDDMINEVLKDGIM